MTDAKRKAAEAERLLAEIAPYCEQVEKDAYEALLIETSADAILEKRREINAIRSLQGALRTAITLGAQAAKPRKSFA